MNGQTDRSVLHTMWPRYGGSHNKQQFMMQKQILVLFTVVYLFYITLFLSVLFILAMPNVDDVTCQSTTVPSLSYSPLMHHNYCKLPSVETGGFRLNHYSTSELLVQQTVPTHHESNAIDELLTDYVCRCIMQAKSRLLCQPKWRVQLMIALTTFLNTHVHFSWHDIELFYVTDDSIFMKACTEYALVQ